MAIPPTFTAVIRQEGAWWIGWVEEVPGVNAQEPTRDDLLVSLRQALREALEFNRNEALDAAGPGYEELALSL
jgi:predicted RNase H-like HicB family nuclease